MAGGGSISVMGKYPLETGNYVLILVGIILIGSGPYILYRTVTGVLKARAADPNAKLHVINNSINILIGIALFFAGILFVINNLRGNPLL